MPAFATYDALQRLERVMSWHCPFRVTTPVVLLVGTARCAVRTSQRDVPTISWMSGSRPRCWTRSRCRVKPRRGCRPGRCRRCGCSCSCGRRCRCRGRCCCCYRRRCRCRCRSLHFQRAFVDSTVHDATKTRATLVEERWRREIRIASVNGWTTGQ